MSSTDRCGTMTGYVYDRCRCDACRAANAAYTRQYRRTHPRESWASAPRITLTARPGGYGDGDDWPQRIIDHAACRGHAELFFPAGCTSPNLRLSRAQRAAIAEAKAICAGCPVLAECRAWALAHPRAVYLAVAGGMSWDERKQHRRLSPVIGSAPAAASTSRPTSPPPPRPSAPEHPTDRP